MQPLHADADADHRQGQAGDQGQQAGNGLGYGDAAQDHTAHRQEGEHQGHAPAQVADAADAALGAEYLELPELRQLLADLGLGWRIRRGGR
ncbi:hypothetical protein D3C84_812670 [compost metagenome]